MMQLKNLLICLLAGSSAAFAVQQPHSPLQKSSVLKMSGGAVDAPPPPPDLKVSQILIFDEINCVVDQLCLTPCNSNIRRRLLFMLALLPLELPRQRVAGARSLN
jgi:hypothetical protein